MTENPWNVHSCASPPFRWKYFYSRNVGWFRPPHFAEGIFTQETWADCGGGGFEWKYKEVGCQGSPSAANQLSYESLEENRPDNSTAMAPLATMLPTVLLLIAASTASGRFIAPEMLGEAQREVYDLYSQAGEQGALAAEELQRQEERIPGEVQVYEEPLMSDIQAPCHNYHGYLAGNIRIAGTVCSSTSRDGCARILIGRRGLFGSMQLCHPDGKHVVLYGTLERHREEFVHRVVLQRSGTCC